MIKIPILNGYDLSNLNKGIIAESYCEIMQSIFFPGGVENASPNFSKTFPIGFLLYTNAHPEFRNFMSQSDTWTFLDTLTSHHLYIFSYKPDKGQETIPQEAEEAMLSLGRIFGLGDMTLNPYLVISDLHFEFRKVGAEGTFDATVGKYASFKIENRPPDEYVNVFRNTLGKLISKGRISSESPCTEIAEAINKSSISNTLKQAVEGLIKDELSKKFAAAWVLLNWRPNTLN